MLHRAARLAQAAIVWLRVNSALAILCFCTLVSAVCLTGNTIWPASSYGYRVELALLFVIGLGALWRARKDIIGAILVYFSGALLPVGLMLAHSASAGDSGSALEYAPLLGVLLVATLARCERATLLYGGIAILASGVFCGQIAGRWGQAGVLAFFSGVLAVVLYAWLGCDLQRAISGQQEIRGLQDKIISRQKEEFSNGP